MTAVRTNANQSGLNRKTNQEDGRYFESIEMLAPTAFKVVRV
jgi:hypothetical protein